MRLTMQLQAMWKINAGVERKMIDHGRPSLLVIIAVVNISTFDPSERQLMCRLLGVVLKIVEMLSSFSVLTSFGGLAMHQRSHIFVNSGKLSLNLVFVSHLASIFE